jgi:hypothetical protein
MIVTVAQLAGPAPGAPAEPRSAVPRANSSMSGQTWTPSLVTWAFGQPARAAGSAPAKGRSGLPHLGQAPGAAPASGGEARRDGAAAIDRLAAGGPASLRGMVADAGRPAVDRLIVLRAAGRVDRQAGAEAPAARAGTEREPDPRAVSGVRALVDDPTPLGGWSRARSSPLAGVADPAPLLERRLGEPSPLGRLSARRQWKRDSVFV